MKRSNQKSQLDFIHGPIEPFKIKMVEHTKLLNYQERKTAIKKAGYNTFLLDSEDVYLDLLTDSGTAAMSDQQWAGLMLGDEAYAGSRNFYNLKKSVNSILGYKYIVPTHQGRGAEHLISKILITGQKKIVPRNMYFTTSRLHVELCGGEMPDVIIDKAHDSNNEYSFKGNIDLVKLQKLIDIKGPDKIAYVNVEMNVNMAGGQPVSMQNLRQIRKFCNKYGLKVIYDATRSSENAYFIKEREKGYATKSITEILKEMMSYSDACIYSAKKDCLVNIGGFLASHDKKLYEKARSLVVVYEGLHTYGGLAGRDMEAMARGLQEGADEKYLQYRIEQTRYLGKMLLAANIPIVKPIGSHAVYLDALKFLPHISREQWPAQTLTAAIYAESGIRTMERGAVSEGRDRKTGKNIFSSLESVRITIPRRVYTNTQMEYVAWSLAKIFQKRKKIKGLKMIYEPKNLRFFQAKFRKLKE